VSSASIERFLIHSDEEGRSGRSGYAPIDFDFLRQRCPRSVGNASGVMGANLPTCGAESFPSASGSDLLPWLLITLPKANSADFFAAGENTAVGFVFPVQRTDGKAILADATSAL